MAQKKKPAKTKKAPAPPAAEKKGKKKAVAKEAPEITAAAKVPAKTKKANATDKPLTPTQKKLIKLKQKMHREIFDKCVEKHFYSGMSDWDEVAIPDKDSDDFSDDDEDNS